MTALYIQQSRATCLCAEWPESVRSVDIVGFEAEDPSSLAAQSSLSASSPSSGQNVEPVLHEPGLSPPSPSSRESPFEQLLAADAGSETTEPPQPLATLRSSPPSQPSSQSSPFGMNFCFTLFVNCNI